MELGSMPPKCTADLLLLQSSMLYFENSLKAFDEVANNCF